MAFRLKLIQEHINPFKYPKISLLVIFSAGFLLRALSFSHAGIWEDEGLYLNIARLIAEGKTPYKDYFENKPYGMMYLISSFFYFFGPNVITARILTSVVSLLTSYFIYIIGTEMYNKKVGLLAATFYTFDPLVMVYSVHVYTETYATFFLVLSAYFALIADRKEGIVYYLISGILIGISFFMKQPGLIMMVVIVLFIFYSHFRKKSFYIGIQKVLVLITGIIVFFSLIVTYYFFIGIFDEFIYSIFTFNLKYSGTSAPLLRRLNLIGRLVLDNILLWVSGSLAIPIFLKNRRDEDVFTLGFFIITFIALMSLKAPFLHYFVQTVPPLCILASYFLNYFFKIIAGLKIKIERNYFLHGAIIILILGSIFLSARSYANEGTDLSSLDEQRLVAEYIKQNTSPDEYIFSSYPGYYFLTERQCPSNYCFLTRMVLEVENIDYPDILQDKKVRYVILRDFFIERRFSEEQVDVIITYIEAHYQIEKTYSFRRETIFIYKSKFW